MTNLAYLAAATACFVGATCVVAGDKANPKSDEYVIAIPDFGNVQKPEADEAAEAVIETYTHAGNNLLGQMRESKTNYQKTLAIYLLGSLKVSAAVWDLVKIIDFQAADLDPGFRGPRWGRYPAQEALSKIGSDSVPPILKALGKEENELRRKLMLAVLIECCSRDAAGLLLETEARSASGRAKVRYEKAISMMSGWK